jgi:hypothetical protein
MSITPERYTRAKNLFNDLKYPVNFYIAEKDLQGGVYGCWRSHLACWDDAISKGYKIIAVFEDDTEIHSRDELDSLIEEALKAFENQIDLEYVALHGEVVPIEESDSRIKWGIPITTAAYVINLERFFSKRNRKDVEPTGNHIDYELSLNPKGSIYVKAGVFEPLSKIMPGRDFGTVNDYGPFLNFTFKIFGYSNVTSTLGFYMHLMRKGPRNQAFRKYIFVKWNEIFVKYLQPKND